MRKIIIIIMIAVLFCGVGYAADMTIDKIIDRVDAMVPQTTTIMTCRQKIITSTGRERNFTIAVWGDNKNDNQTMVYLSPASVQGTVFVMLHGGDEIWTYFSDSKRLRQLAASSKNQKVMGSDFTYDDMSSQKKTGRYSFRLLGEELCQWKMCYKIECIPNEKGPDCDKEIIWVRKDRFIPVQAEIYDNGKKEPIKRMIIGNYRMFGQYIVACKISMTNLQKGSTTEFYIDKAYYDVSLSANVFNPSEYKHGMTH